jgi:hypothetical protein
MRQNRFEFEMIMMVGVLAAALPAFGLSHCAFQRAGDTYTGGCGPLFDQTPAMTLAREAAITTGVWSTDVRPTSAWIGTMTDDGDTDSLELEIDARIGGSADRIWMVRRDPVCGIGHDELRPRRLAGNPA